MENSLVIGAGEIGKSVFEVIKRRTNAFIRDVDGPEFSDIDVLHIAFPYSESFVDDVKAYVEKYNPNLTIVYSTTPIGTCEKIGAHIVHSPVEGRHPHLEESIMLAPRWVGCEDTVALRLAVEFWTRHTKKVRTLRSSVFTEFLKLRSTAKYGVNLAWADHEAKIAGLLGLNFKAVKEFDEDYNELYRDLGYGDMIARYILDPPNGYIGGHCVVPNAVLLDEQFPHPYLKAIKKMKGKKNARKASKED